MNNNKIFKVYKNINTKLYLILLIICFNSYVVFSNEENKDIKLILRNEFKNEKMTILINDILYIKEFNFISDRKNKNTFFSTN